MTTIREKLTSLGVSVPDNATSYWAGPTLIHFNLVDGGFLPYKITGEQHWGMYKYGITGTLGWVLDDEFLGVESLP